MLLQEPRSRAIQLELDLQDGGFLEGGETTESEGSDEAEVLGEMESISSLNVSLWLNLAEI
jgi:hypothetical protein